MKTLNALGLLPHFQAVVTADDVVNGKPALEWVMERQVVKTDKDSGIENDANRYATETVGNPAPQNGTSAAAPAAASEPPAAPQGMVLVQTDAAALAAAADAQTPAVPQGKRRADLPRPAAAAPAATELTPVETRAE